MAEFSAAVVLSSAPTVGAALAGIAPSIKAAVPANTSFLSLISRLLNVWFVPAYSENGHPKSGFLAVAAGNRTFVIKIFSHDGRRKSVRTIVVQAIASLCLTPPP